jgi:hypothetical protein
MNAPKRSAPGREIAGAAKLRVARSYQFCSHSATRIEEMPRGYAHHAHEVCTLCGAFIRWLPRPQTRQRRRLNAFRLARLAMCDRLTSWERRFVANVSGKGRLSPKQQALIDRLYADYLEAKSL